MTDAAATVNAAPALGAIKPVRCLSSAGMVTATRMEIVSNFDNLTDLAVFGYTIYDENSQVCLSGVVELRGADEYNTWDATRAGAYRIVAQKLQLELT